MFLYSGIDNWVCDCYISLLRCRVHHSDRHRIGYRIGYRGWYGWLYSDCGEFLHVKNLVCGHNSWLDPSSGLSLFI